MTTAMTPAFVQRTALTEDDGHTHVSLTQDDNATAEEVEQSGKTWQSTLEALKRLVEGE
jgi:hypothetical protein